MDYKSPRWVHKRKKILRRDKYLCQVCKRYGKSREADTVHHIYPAEDYPELIWKDDNLISLCHKCHNSMHDRTTNELTNEGKALMKKVRG